MSATVAPDSILKELAALWTQEGKQGDAGVLRACSMTLLVIAEAADDAAALGETIAALMPEHPARTILIRLQGDGERALSQRVYQQCWKPFGQRQQICCEQIEITASDAALADLPSVILPLAVPDLPVILWCRSARLVRRPEFGAIARMATKVVIDSAAAADSTEAIRRMADAVRRGGILADLAWTRLTRWRETLARVFENRDTLAHLSEVDSVQVRFGPGYETAAWYMAAWAANALASVGQVVTPVVLRQDESLRLELSGGNVPRGTFAGGRAPGDGGQRAIQLHQSAAAHRLSADARGTGHRAPRRGLRKYAGVRGPACGIFLIRAIMSVRWHKLPDANAAAEAGAHHIIGLLEEVLSGQEFATFAVSGGSTPKLMFQKLAATRFPWDKVHIFWVDERCVPPTDVASNYKLADDFLIHPAHIPGRNVHRVLGELTPATAAKRYAGEVRDFFGLEEGEMPRFDVVHRGMGPDAHTASLFPGDPLIDDREGIAAAVFAEKFHQWRVTLLPGALLAAKHTVFVVAGDDKAEAVRAVFQEEYDPKKYPAQIASHHGRGVTWFLDEAAARLME